MAHLLGVGYIDLLNSRWRGEDGGVGYCSFHDGSLLPQSEGYEGLLPLYLEVWGGVDGTTYHRTALGFVGTSD